MTKNKKRFSVYSKRINHPERVFIVIVERVDSIYKRNDRATLCDMCTIYLVEEAISIWPATTASL
jgi:hypothetical protein